MFELLVVGPVLSFCEGLLSVVFENHGVFVECVTNVMISRSDYISVNL